MRMIKVLAVFTLGSLAGLVTFSHILNYVLKHYKKITLSVLMGFIIGSLGVLWPWKETIYKTGVDGSPLLDSTGNMILENYSRYIPDLSKETFIALAYVILGVLIVLALEWYGQKNRNIKT